METATLEVDPPSDRNNLVYITMILHGIGTLTAWNMFITAKEYFVSYKLGDEYLGGHYAYADNFFFCLTLFSQIPNLLLNWLNVFIEIKGSLTKRIVLSISVEVLLFVLTVVLAMVNSSNWPGAFFWITMITVMLLNGFNGVFQNSVYGVAARLPAKYTGAVVLGSNISGMFAAIASIVGAMATDSPRTSAVYYFLSALFILLACFDTYFALPLNRFYRYHELMAAKTAARNTNKGRPPYWKIFCKAFPQLLNVFLIFFVTLSIFPGWHSDIQQSSPDFFISKSLYVKVLCFLTFNICATLGSTTASLFNWPGPRYLFIFVWIRFTLLPLFLLCNYQPLAVTRYLPVLIDNDWAYWALAFIMAWSSGHLSSLSMMYIGGTVESQYAPQAGMFGAAALITGITAGLTFSKVGPYIVGSTLFGDST